MGVLAKSELSKDSKHNLCADIFLTLSIYCLQQMVYLPNVLTTWRSLWLFYWSVWLDLVHDPTST